MGGACAHAPLIAARAPPRAANVSSPNRSIALTDAPSLLPPLLQSEDMQQDAIDTASQAMEKFNIEKDIAAYIKKECA